MMKVPMHNTTEGYTYISATNTLKSGHPSPAVISPATYNASETSLYDVIIVGAGYAGLISARELTARGYSVLLLEARDRIGGRTWTSFQDGHAWEMGGTWVHWGQPHVYTEISRYELADELEDSADFSQVSDGGKMCASIVIDGRRRDLSYEEQYAMLEKGYSVFSSIETDEHSGQRAIPYPHNIDMTSNIVQQYDCKSVADRLKEVEDQLTAEELGLISSTICQNSGGTLANTSFLEILRWWLLGGESTKSFLSYVIKYKLKCGQSGLARKIFDDACSLGRLAYAFNTAVQTVEQDDGFVRLSVTPSKQFRARKVVCTVPLNVLKDIKFQPALDPVKQEAIMQGHIDHMIKVHIEAKGSAWRTWSGTAWPGEGLAGAYGDGLTQAGNSHLVAFGPNAPFDVANNPRKLVEAVRHLNDEIEVERFVFHDWNEDPFSKGAWCVFPPGFTTKYLKALQQSHGDVLFCSGDWADGGWRGFIDGAIEQGLRVSNRLITELRQENSARANV